jgi:hypothetical protein
MDQSFNQEPGTVVITTKSITPTTKTKPKPKDRVAGKARVIKRQASKTASPTTSPPRDGSPSKAPTGVEKEKESKLPIKSWQNIHQQDLRSDFLFKSPTPSIVSSNYIFKHPALPPTQMLPPITPLLGAANLNPHQDRENRQAIVVEELRPPSQENMHLPSRSYPSRIEDISIISNGKSPVDRQAETQIRSRYIATAQDSMWKPHNW